jgi:hypothetical protein
VHPQTFVTSAIYCISGKQAAARATQGFDMVSRNTPDLKFGKNTDI